jgi:hypothetical protein
MFIEVSDSGCLSFIDDLDIEHRDIGPIGDQSVSTHVSCNLSAPARRRAASDFRRSCVHSTNNPPPSSRRLPFDIFEREEEPTALLAEALRLYR